MRIWEGHESTRNLFQCGSNEQGEDKKKGLQFKNSGYRLKILAIFHQFLSEDQKKKKSLRPKSIMKSGVSPQTLRKYGRKTPIWES